MTVKSPLCARCGHSRRRHVISEVNGSCQCTALCNCTDYVEPKAEHEPVGNYIAEQYQAGLAAAEEKFPTDKKEPLGSWEHDAVNHPSHYTAYPGIEVIQLTRHMTFNRGNAVKYVARAGLKNKETEVEDLEKAIWYLQDEVKLLKGEHEG